MSVVPTTVSCTTTTEEGAPMAPYEEAELELDGISHAVQQRIGGEWENLDGIARSCASRGVRGAQSPAHRFGPDVELADQQALVNEVVTAWTDSGFTPVVREWPPLDGVVVTEVNHSGEGTDRSGMYFSLTESTGATGTGEQTQWGTGDCSQIDEQYDQQ